MDYKTQEVELLFPEETKQATPKIKTESKNIKAKYTVVISLICVIVAVCAYGGYEVLMEKSKTDLNTDNLQINKPIVEDKQDIKDLQLDDMTISIGQTVKPILILTPQTATGEGFIWTIENPSIASVDSEGIITGVGVGITTLTVTTGDNKISTSSTITITEAIEEPIINEPQETPNSSCLVGDINYDGLINSLDMIKLTDYVNGSLYNEEIISCIDLNGDAKINFLDIIELQVLMK